MLMIANAPLLVTRIIIPVLSVATAIDTIIAGIVLGVIVGKQFKNTQIVIRSPTIIVLNRLIEPNELTFFYNVPETMDVVVGDMKQVLKIRFGNQFVNVEFTNFSSTPNVTSNNRKKGLYQ